MAYSSFTARQLLLDVLAEFRNFDPFEEVGRDDDEVDLDKLAPDFSFSFIREVMNEADFPHYGEEALIDDEYDWLTAVGSVVSSWVIAHPSEAIATLLHELRSSPWRRVILDGAYRVLPKDPAYREEAIEQVNLLLDSLDRADPGVAPLSEYEANRLAESLRKFSPDRRAANLLRRLESQIRERLPESAEFARKMLSYFVSGT